MRTLAELISTAQRMQDFLEVSIDTTKEEILIDRMELLQVLIAKSGNLLADAKYLQDTAKQDAVYQVVGDPSLAGLPTTSINKFIDACGKEFNHVVTWFDRINSAASKQHAGLITILSYRKEQMKMV